MEVSIAPAGEFYSEPFIGWKMFRVFYPNTNNKSLSQLVSLHYPTAQWSQSGLQLKKIKPDNQESWCHTGTENTWRQNEKGIWYLYPRKKEAHESPSIFCNCGWHTYNSFNDMLKDGLNGPGGIIRKYREGALGIKDDLEEPFRNCVLALVWAFGDPVWVWDNTTRSRYMKIAALSVDGTVPKTTVRKHAAALSVPALSLAEMHDYYEVGGIQLGGAL